VTADAPYPELKKTHSLPRVGRPFTDRKPPPAAPVWAAIEGYGRFHVLASAVELGVFDRLDALGPTTGADLAAVLDVSAPHLTSLLEGVVALGLLEHRHGRFEMNDTARRYLTTDGPASMSALVPVAPGPLANWQDLTATVRSGTPARPIEDDPAAFYVPLVEATFTTINRAAMRTDGFVRYSALPAARVLELGAGGAPWAVAVLSATPDATAVVNDLDGVVGVARRKLAEHGLSERVEIRAGDYLEIEVEPESYDLAILGHICRAESTSRVDALIERAFVALRPGGRLILSDYFADRQRSTAGHALMMGVTMMASTRHGRTFTYGDVADRIRNAGFERVRLIEPIGFQELFVATRPAPSQQRNSP
jgi:ubiquinone/menaquinone biosynthesis C-methylase UbiE